MKKRTLALILCGVIITALLPSFHTAIAAEGEAVIATDKINVRGGPGLSYGIKAEVKKGERYPIAKEEGDWVQLQLSPGKTGWVVSWLISKTAGEQQTIHPQQAERSLPPILTSASEKARGHHMKSSANFRKAHMHPCLTRTADG